MGNDDASSSTAPDAEPAPESEAPRSKGRRVGVTRRGILVGLAAGATSGAIGLAAGYKFRHELHGIWQATVAKGSLDAPGAGTFTAEEAAIIARRGRLSAETTAALRAEYEKPLFGKVRVWDLFEKLSLCIDTTDLQLFAVSQYVHVQQILAAMERERVEDPDMHLIALLHDLGKVSTVVGAPPEHILGGSDMLRDAEEGVGLDHAVFRYNHAELIYSRIEHYVPDHVAWACRYHNIDIDGAAPIMSARERDYAERYLRPFRRYDTGFKSMYYAPTVDMEKYRALIGETFPKPILF